MAAWKRPWTLRSGGLLVDWGACWLLLWERAKLADQFQRDLRHLEAARAFGLICQLEILGVAEQLGVGELQAQQFDLCGIWLAAAAPEWGGPEI